MALRLISGGEDEDEETFGEQITAGVAEEKVSNNQEMQC